MGRPAAGGNRSQFLSTVDLRFLMAARAAIGRGSLSVWRRGGKPLIFRRKRWCNGTAYARLLVLGGSDGAAAPAQGRAMQRAR